MMEAFFKRDLFRWFLAAVAVVVAFFLAQRVILFLLIYFPLPLDVTTSISGFAIGLLIVLAGSLVAPRQNLVVALVLMVACTTFTTYIFPFPLLSILIGSIVAVTFVAWKFHSWRTRRSAIWFIIGVCVAFFVLVGVEVTKIVDLPAHPEELTPELNSVLGKNATQVTAFYCYDRGGFIDRECLWRLDGKPEAIALVVSGLGLQSTNTVPPSFWRMAPHYWPRAMPAGGEAFQSQNFPWDSRGSDGKHYFMVYDKAQSRAFVWVKDNF